MEQREQATDAVAPASSVVFGAAGEVSLELGTTPKKSLASAARSAMIKIDGATAEFEASYTVGDQLGSGAFATVYRVTRRDSGAEFAMKDVSLRRLNPAARERLLREIEILRVRQPPFF